MSEASLTRHFLEFTEEPVRRDSPDESIRLNSSVNFRGNFHRVVEVTSGQQARERLGRGQ